MSGQPRARVSPRKSVRERLVELADETGTEELVHEFQAFLSELSARQPDHPILTRLVGDMGRRSAQAVSVGLLHDIGNLLQVAESHLDVMADNLSAVFDPSRLPLAQRVEMFTQFLDGLSAARVAARGAGELSLRGVRVYARSDDQADVQEVLETAADLGRRLVRKRAELSLDVRAEGRVVASRADLLRVLVNLIRNAADAVAGQMGPMVMVEAWQTPEHAFVSVADNGPGIPEQALDHVLELFYTTKGEGAGVGLFVCNMLVRGWGGELQVDSHRGSGARFTAKIPRVI